MNKLEYQKDPNVCLNCLDEVPFSKQASKKLFCNSSCAASFNNVQKEKKPYPKCLHCGKQLSKRVKKYCSNKCQGEHISKGKLEHWLQTGQGLPQGSIRDYLIEKADRKCTQCSWSGVNPKSGKVSLVIDHIDGNSENNSPSNLRVLCPNCDSLTPTYKALNKGNGRHSRRQRYKEGKSY